MADQNRSGGITVPICVRSLSGGSTIVKASSSQSIHDIKVALKSTFPPASSAPNFHLFFKGAKLSLDTRVSAISVNGGDFLVLVPFIKKERPQTPKPDLSKPSTSSNFSNSAYSEMIQQCSTFKEENVKTESNPCVGEKRKRDEEPCAADEFLKGVLESGCNDGFKGQKNTEKLAEVLESRTCLVSPRSAKCLMSSEIDEYSCSCPDWLKLSMQTFTFLNLFSSLVESYGETLYLARLKDSLSRLAVSGVRVGIDDIRDLSVISPEVVKITTDRYEAANYENAIVIADYMEIIEVENEIYGRKKTPLAKVFSAMKKRETSFKAELSKSIKLLLVKNRSKRGMTLSLEDMLTFAKEGKVVGGNEARQARNSRSSGSSCINTNSLLPEEMVKHLKSGIGAKGQIVHVEDIKGRKAAYVDIPGGLSEITKSALKRIGISKLYSHQAESISAALSGKNIAIATMTSSGNSLLL